MGKKQTLDEFVQTTDAERKAERERRIIVAAQLKPHLNDIGDIVRQKIAIVLRKPVEDILVTEEPFEVTIIGKRSDRQSIKITIRLNAERRFFMDGYRWLIHSTTSDSDLAYPKIGWSRSIKNAQKGISDEVERWIKRNIAYIR